MFDLSQSNEELARELLAQYPEGEEMFDRGLCQQLLYDPTTRDPARYAEICRLASELTDSPERKATFHLERINGLRRVAGNWDIQAVIALLILARVNRALGLKGVARELLHLVVHYPGHGARVARAVAKHELVGLSE